MKGMTKIRLIHSGPMALIFPQLKVITCFIHLTIFRVKIVSVILGNDNGIFSLISIFGKEFERKF